MLASDPEILVIGSAKNGEDALSKIASLHPDVVTMDVEMPKMDGLTAVQKIMENSPLPVVMISALTQREAALTFKALELGAVDYLPKPAGQISLNMADLKEELIAKVKTASFANIAPIKMVHENVYSPVKSSDKVISIAASTGGPFALSQVLKVLPENTPPILIVQHMPKGFTKFFAESLGSRCMVKVKEAEDGDRIQAGLAMVAPAGFHMMVNKSGKVSFDF